MTSSLGRTLIRVCLGLLVIGLVAACLVEPSSGSPSVVPVATAASAAGLVLTVSIPEGEVKVGDEVGMIVKLENNSEETIQAKKLVFDSASLSFDITYKGKEYRHTHWGVQNNRPVKPAPAPIAPGASVTLTHPFYAIKAGTCSITASYRGSEPSLKTDPFQIEVLPRDEVEEVTVVIETNHGTIKGRLFPEGALNTSLHFVNLAREGYYDGIIFHRVIDGFMIQGGDPTGTGTGGPGYNIPDELASHLRHKSAGIFSMAKTRDPNTGGSQFFITLGPTPHLDNLHTVFGEVTDGLIVVKKIGKVQTGPGDRPLKEVVMRSVRILPEGKGKEGE